VRLPEAARAPRPLPPHPSDHHHGVPRRAFLHGSAGAAGLLLGSGLLGRLPALAAPPGTGQPKPIPGGITVGGRTFHLFLPGPGAEPATITDLNGFSGVAVVDGTWAATGTPTGGVASGVWEADMRFMKGLFVGTDGLRRQGAFAFI
jgi:hypothetical protein